MVEGQGWDEMILDQHWQTAADVASVVVGGRRQPSEPVVVNINVPNLAARRDPRLAPRWWRATPPRAFASAGLDRSSGRRGCYSIRMEFGDPIIARDADSRAIERDEVAITYSSRLSPNHATDARPASTRSCTSALGAPIDS